MKISPIYQASENCTNIIPKFGGNLSYPRKFYNKQKLRWGDVTSFLVMSIQWVSGHIEAVPHFKDCYKPSLAILISNNYFLGPWDHIRGKLDFNILTHHITNCLYTEISDMRESKKQTLIRYFILKYNTLEEPWSFILEVLTFRFQDYFWFGFHMKDFQLFLPTIKISRFVLWD